MAPLTSNLDYKKREQLHALALRWFARAFGEPDQSAERGPNCGFPRSGVRVLCPMSRLADLRAAAPELGDFRAVIYLDAQPSAPLPRREYELIDAQGGYRVVGDRFVGGLGAGEFGGDSFSSWLALVMALDEKAGFMRRD